MTSQHGWRWAAGIVAICAGAIIPLVMLLMRERPSDLGLLPYGATVAAPPHQRPEGNPLAGAFLEEFGDYLLAFSGAGLLGIFAGFAALRIARSPRRPEPQPT